MGVEVLGATVVGLLDGTEVLGATVVGLPEGQLVVGMSVGNVGALVGEEVDGLDVVGD